MIITRRWRNEYKYMIDAVQEGILRTRIEGIMNRDAHVNEDGTYIIRSLYFDDYEDSCLSDNLSGADPRSKFRIRYYNSDTTYIQLEKKSKSHGLCIKTSCMLTEDECETIIDGYTLQINSEMTEEKRTLLSEIGTKDLRPTVIVTYERIPYVYDCGNVRITIDRNITSSGELERFLSGGYRERPVLGLGRSILEVKWDYILPEFLRDIVSVEKLEHTAFSKYYMCRRFSF